MSSLASASHSSTPIGMLAASAAGPASSVSCSASPSINASTCALSEAVVASSLTSRAVVSTASSAVPFLCRFGGCSLSRQDVMCRLRAVTLLWWSKGLAHLGHGSCGARSVWLLRAAFGSGGSSSGFATAAASRVPVRGSPRGTAGSGSGAFSRLRCALFDALLFSRRSRFFSA